MNNIKLILILILLSLFLLQNIYVFYKEKFSLNGLDNYLDSQIGKLSLQHDLSELNLTEDSNIKNITLHKDKLLLTLFYDRYDKYSAYFYDDSMKMSIKRINEIQKERAKEEYKREELETIEIPFEEFKEDNNKKHTVRIHNAVDFLRRRIKHVRDIRNARNIMEDMKGIVFNDASLKGQGAILLRELKTIVDSIINQIMGISERRNLSRNPDVKYNSKKARYEYRGEDSLNEKKTNYDSKINELQNYIDDTREDIETNKAFYEKKIADELDTFNNENKPGAWNQIRYIHKYEGDLYLHKNFFEISEVLCDVYHMDKCHIRTSDLYQTIRSSEENKPLEAGVLNDKLQNIGTYLTKKQPHRDDRLVDKLPKVILSFVTPFEGEFKKHIYEYNGMYNYNDKFDNTSRDNILMFLQETIDKELVINNIDDTECFNGSDHNFNTSDTSPYKNNYNQRPFYYDYGLVKCANCCYFIRTEKLRK